jgi:hypothetical protein
VLVIARAAGVIAAIIAAVAVVVAAAAVIVAGVGDAVIVAVLVEGSSAPVA